MRIVNYDTIANNVVKSNHYNDNAKLPRWPFRMCIVGGSGCGKTNLLLNLLLNEDGVQYDNLIVVSPSLYQDKYRYMIDHFDQAYEDDKQTILKSIAKANKKRSMANKLTLESLMSMDDTLLRNRLQTYDSLRHYKDEFNLDACHKDERNLFVFDDVLDQKGQEAITSTFSRGRHVNASCIYISQSYFSIPKAVRLNCTAYVLFKLNNKELREIAQRVASDVDFKDFKAYFANATANKFGHIVIDESNKYRRGFS